MKKLLCLFLFMLGLSSSHAHKLAPALLEIHQLDQHSAEVQWKIGLNPTAADWSAPRGCERRDHTQQVEAQSLITQSTLHCPQGLAGQQLHLNKLAESQSSALLRFHDGQGREHRQLIQPQTPYFDIPKHSASDNTLTQYLGLGMEHIAGGLDHLLFVLALVFLIPGHKKLFWSVTAFTLGHSLSLAASSLGLIQLDSGWVELCIAASIFYLALQWSRGGHTPLYPLITAFGLLHGFGFAGALAEFGLPQGEFLIALLSFNIGIEIGQLIFVAAAIVLIGLAKRFRQFDRLHLICLYLVGSLSAYWCLERALQIL